jgi:hypothetical protein
MQVSQFTSNALTQTPSHIASAAVLEDLVVRPATRRGRAQASMDNTEQSSTFHPRGLPEEQTLFSQSPLC